MISITFNFLTLKNRPTRWRTLYVNRIPFVFHFNQNWNYGLGTNFSNDL